jgi:hypothetical protein
MQKLNFKTFLEAEEGKKSQQGDFFQNMSSVWGIEPKHVGKALDGMGPPIITQKVYDKKEIGLAPAKISSNKGKTGAKVEVMAGMSPYVFVNNRLNKNAKKSIKGFVDRDQMIRMFLLGFPNSDNPPEDKSKPT